MAMGACRRRWRAWVAAYLGGGGGGGGVSGDDEWHHGGGGGGVSGDDEWHQHVNTSLLRP